MQYVMTNARSKTYSWIESSQSTSGETIPSGLAAAILKERSGELRSERMTVRCGDTLPKLGDLCDGLILQRVEINCAQLEETQTAKMRNLTVKDRDVTVRIEQ